MGFVVRFRVGVTGGLRKQRPIRWLLQDLKAAGGCHNVLVRDDETPETLSFMRRAAA